MPYCAEERAVKLQSLWNQKLDRLLDGFEQASSIHQGLPSLHMKMLRENSRNSRNAASTTTRSSPEVHSDNASEAGGPHISWSDGYEGRSQSMRSSNSSPDSDNRRLIIWIREDWMNKLQSYLDRCDVLESACPKPYTLALVKRLRTECSDELLCVKNFIHSQGKRFANIQYLLKMLDPDASWIPQSLAESPRSGHGRDKVVEMASHSGACASLEERKGPPSPYPWPQYVAEDEYDAEWDTYSICTMKLNEERCQPAAQHMPEDNGQVEEQMQSSAASTATTQHTEVWTPTVAQKRVGWPTSETSSFVEEPVVAISSSKAAQPGDDIPNQEDTRPKDLGHKIRRVSAVPDLRVETTSSPPQGKRRALRRKMGKVADWVMARASSSRASRASSMVSAKE